MREYQSLKFWLADEQQTRQAGAVLAATLLSVAESEPVVVFVRGDLGAGKSTLVRGFLTQAGINGVMPSPTYSLVEPYQAAGLKIFHMDAYRLADASELDYLGLDDIDAPGSILLVEWPDHISASLPKPTLTLDLNMSPHPDRHTLEQGQAQPSTSEKTLDSRRESQAQAGTDSGKNSIKTMNSMVSIEIGRLLSISTTHVPVQLRRRLEASAGWDGILRVVT